MKKQDLSKYKGTLLEGKKPDRHRNLIGWLLMILFIAIIFVGRFKTFHCTEGEALIEGLWYWLSALVVAAVAFIYLLKTERKS